MSDQKTRLLPLSEAFEHFQGNVKDFEVDMKERVDSIIDQMEKGLKKIGVSDD